ncbi:hypothetical protein LPA44_17095 [Halobacterium sp. KA-4]|uniref:hypothetical protein n=1 Tax=Halobacterium sp. KA-4 TaxID=2896367 RepID=UPI001E350EF4|nr:hypothetical protein [Halobacterium sp. KA-4]MCD2201581.1 hypothetical protein [Halobacterium sp. KA-4]
MSATPLPTPKALARAYDTPSYDDPYEAVTDYQEYLELADEHSDLGSHALASRLDLPRGRVRPWTNGSRPDAVRGIQTAESNRWLSNTDPAPERERAIVQLAAWVLSGGSLSLLREQGARISFVLDAGREDAFAAIAATAGLDYQIVHDDDSNRATEARPTEGGSVLARILHAMGVPTGEKSADGPTALPSFVHSPDAGNRGAFARVYVKNRATTYENKDTLTLQEKRPKSYLEDLAVLLRTVTGESVTRDENGITVSAAAARELLDEPPDLRDCYGDTGGSA